jgi:hypothetical protein
MTDIFNTTIHGEGLEGFINWTNIISGDLMVSLFIIFLAVVGYIVGKKQGLSATTAIALSGILIIILTPIFQLFTIVNGQLVIAGLIMIAIGIGGYFLGK